MNRHCTTRRLLAVEVAALHYEGLTGEQIARAFGFSTTTAYTLIQEADWSPPRYPLTVTRITKSGRAFLIRGT